MRIKLNRELVKQRLREIGENGVDQMNDEQLIEEYCLSGLFSDNEANDGYYEEEIEGLK